MQSIQTSGRMEPVELSRTLRPPLSNSLAAGQGMCDSFLPRLVSVPTTGLSWMKSEWMETATARTAKRKSLAARFGCFMFPSTRNMDSSHIDIMSRWLLGYCASNNPGLSLPVHLHNCKADVGGRKAAGMCGSAGLSKAAEERRITAGSRSAVRSAARLPPGLTHRSIDESTGRRNSSFRRALASARFLPQLELREP